MKDKSLKKLFGLSPYLRALVLIRVPNDPSTSATDPDPNDEFGTAFFVTGDGILCTVAHNVTERSTAGEPDPHGKPLPWVWVCCYDEGTKDWTDARKVSVDPNLVDSNLDAAVLRVPNVRVTAALRLAADWQLGDSVAVLGFQPQSGRKSGFTARYLMCRIPQNWDVAPLDIARDTHEPTLRLGFVDPDQEPLGEGISGGPVLNVNCEGYPAIAIEKLVEPAFGLRPPEVKTTAVNWMREFLECLPEARSITWLPRRKSGGETSAGEVPRLRDRQAERRYRERVIAEHERIDILGRSKPLDLENIYIALRVAKYVAPEQRPDEASRRTNEAVAPQGPEVIDAVEAVRRKPHRLVVLGDPGSGKTTLLRYLALRLARRDPAFGDWAREIIPSRPAATADRVRRGLLSLGENTFSATLYGGAVALGLWARSIFASSHRLWAAAALPVLAFGLYIILGRTPRSVSHVSATACLLLLALSAHFSLVPRYALVAMGIALVVPLYPYWTAPVVKWLSQLRNRLTRYPLPLYLTLNDVVRSGEQLEVHLARTLKDAAFADPEQFLRRRLDDGGCLVLLDALDEVMDESAYRWMAEEIARFTNHHWGVPVVVTSRSASFRDRRTLLLGFRRVEVQEFAEKEVERFIRTWFEGAPSAEQARAESLRQSLGRNPRMRLLSANPLLLSLMCYHSELDLRLPDRRVELYQQCAGELLEAIDHDRGLAGHARFSPNDKRHVLRTIARRFHDEGVRVFGEKPLLVSIAAALADLGIPATRNEDFLRELMARSGMIRQLSRTSYGFAHLTWQEFLTGENFHLRGSAASLLAHAGESWWREVILLYAGLEPDATSIVRRLADHDLLLGAAALADVTDPGTAEFESLRREIVDRLKALIETDADRRQDAADALAGLARWGATEYLVECFRNQGQPEVSLAAVLALDQAGDRAELAKLCERLGPMLQLLTRHLDKVAGVDERILALLDRLGLPLVEVPAGEFLMGDPTHRAHLDRYWIAKFPITNALYRRFCTETGHASAPEVGQDDHPVVKVRWRDAVAFCRWAGTVLPSEAEWEKAARGTDGRRYPWGDRWEAGRCNVGTAGTTPVGAYPGDVSPWGCYDMGGNVQDWTRSEYAAAGRDSMDERAALVRGVRGGSFGGLGALARAAARGWSVPGARDGNLGFRVVVFPFTSGSL